jgi:hypothetical protein
MDLSWNMSSPVYRFSTRLCGSQKRRLHRREAAVDCKCRGEGMMQFSGSLNPWNVLQEKKAFREVRTNYASFNIL